MNTRLTGNVAGLLLAAVGWTALAAVAAPLKGEVPERNAALAQEWARIGRLPNFWEGTWQGVTGLYHFPAPVQYTAEAAEYVKNYRPTDDTVMANCAMPGMPFVMNQGAMPIKFLPAPGMVALYIETYAVTRFFHTDGRKMDDIPNPTFLGTSVAHWEADALVVDSRGFVQDTLLQIGALPPLPGAQFSTPIFKAHGPNLRFVERMHLKDYNTLEITTTIHDDTIFATPYTSTREWHRYTGRNSDPQEWVCSDNRDYYDTETGKLHYDVQDKSVTTSEGAGRNLRP
jgi:hypothetical protein